MEYETIYGQVISKSNNYMAVPDSAGGRRIIKNDAIREYERNFLNQCKVYRGRLINARFKLIVKIFYKSNCYDLDNSLKTILDCLQYAKAITNDNLCVAIDAEKKIDARNPRIVYAIEELEPTLFH